MPKLGFQTQDLTPAVVAFALRAQIGCFKAIDPQPLDLVRELRTALPNCVFIFRPYFGQQPLDNPKQRATEVYDRLMPVLGQGGWQFGEGYNECGLWNDAYPYIEFTIELARLLQTQGQHLLAYSFAWGNPSGFYNGKYEDNPAAWLEGLRQHWAPYCDGLRAVKAAGGGVARHSYKIPGQAGMFSVYRHQLDLQVFPDDLKDIPIHLTEFGLDATGQAENGWRGPQWNWTAEQYAAWLVGTCGAIGNEVDTAAIFGCGMRPDWWSFETLDQPVIADAIRLVNIAGGGQPMPVIPSIIDYRENVKAQIWALGGTGSYARRALSAIDTWVIHHVGAGDTGYPPDGVVRYHVQTLGWPGPGYHYFIGGDGKIYWLQDLENISYQTSGHNEHTVGVCLAGDFTSSTPTAAQLESLTWLVDQNFIREWEIKPHRELSQTSCPGDGWYENWFDGAEPTVPPNSEPTTPPADTVLARLAELEARVEALELMETAERGIFLGIADAIELAGL